MARTVGDAIARARKAIGDPDGDRADDPTCEGYVRDALNIVKTARPDLFLGSYDTDIGELTSDDALPIGDQFFLPVAMFVAAQIETQDDESSDRARGELVSKIGGAML